MDNMMLFERYKALRFALIRDLLCYVTLACLLNIFSELGLKKKWTDHDNDIVHMFINICRTVN